jgi:hypothetical protein
LVPILISLVTIPNVTAVGSLVGKVLGDDMYNRNIPLPWANVTAYANGVLVLSVSPRFDGSYTMSLPPGRYAVTAEYPGFNAQIRTVDISDGRSTRLDFYLDVARPSVSNTFDFGLSVDSPIMVRAGESGWTKVQVVLLSGSPQIVSLFLSGVLPSSAPLSLSSGFGSPSFSSICTIVTAPTTPAGSYTVTLIGVGGGIIHRTSFALVVSPPNRSIDIP